MRTRSRYSMTADLFPKVVISRSFLPSLCITKYRLGKYDYNTLPLKGTGFQYHYMHPDFVNFVLNTPPTFTALLFANAINEEYMKFLQYHKKPYRMKWKLHSTSKYAFSISDFPF